LLALLALLALTATPAGASDHAPKHVKIDDFEAGISAKWDRKVFKGKTHYEAVADKGNQVLRAHTEGGASGLVHKLKLDLKEFPILTWRWKVEGVFEDGDARSRSGDDYPARVYVVFPGWQPIFSRSINYIWANKLPKGEHVTSTFHSGTMMVALQSGDSNVGGWVTERRNVLEDYLNLFGNRPPRVGAIAIMTDGDQTGGSATAYYDDLRFESENEGSVPLDTGAAKR
jgi:hypothetical protein